MACFSAAPWPASARRRDSWAPTCRRTGSRPSTTRCYARLAEGTPLIAGIPEVFDALDAAGIPYAVGSNGPHRKMAVTLGQHPAIHARLEGRHLLAPDARRGRNRRPTSTSMPPPPSAPTHRTCAVIEDSPTGARAAAAAGMTCFGYAAGGDPARLAAEGARPFHHMDDLAALLGL